MAKADRPATHKHIIYNDVSDGQNPNFALVLLSKAEDHLKRASDQVHRIDEV